MTKMNTKHYILLMAAALTMAGCAFDDPMEKQKPWEENDSDLPKPVTFSVSTTNNVDFTRAAESIVTFNKDEKIRVLVKPLGSEAYTPYDYTTAEKGQNVALTAPDPQPYFPAGVHTTVNAYAYYPATATTGSSLAFTVADYQRDSADYKASDLMMAENRTITKDVDEGKDKLTMKHLMAQLRIKAVPDSTSDLKITKILVEAKRSLFFTPEGATVATTTGEIGTITVLNENDLAACKGGEGYILIPPQAINGITIKVVTGQGRPREIASYGFTAEGTFQAGNSYGVDITVTPKQLGFTTAIANWNGMGSVLIAPTGDLVIDPIDAQPYGYGTPVEPEIKVRKGTTLLTKDTHYEVKYLNNIEAGTAYVVVMGKKSEGLGPDDPGYFDYTSSVGVAPFTISSGMATISYRLLSDTTVVYGCQPFYTIVNNGGDGIVTYKSDNPLIATIDSVSGLVTTVKPGTTIIRATVEDGANYVYAANAKEVFYTLHVEKAPGSIKFDEEAPSQSWNADDSKNYFNQPVTHVGNATVTYTIPATTSENNTCGATIDGSTIRFTKAGQVVVTATVEDNEYYTYDETQHRATATYTLTVTKALGFVHLSEYSGSVPYQQNLKLFTIGENHGGTVTVASNDETIATATYSGGNVHVRGVNAGTTKIVVTCAATAQYLEAKAEFTVDVGKIAITGVTAPTAKDLTYTGSAQALVNVGHTSNGTMQYRLGTDQAWSNDVPQVTNAGTYQVYWQVAGNENYSTYTPQEPIEVTIAKAAPTCTAPTAKNLTYDGSAQALLNAGSTSHGVIQFSRDGTGGWGTGIPTETNAGTYTIYWKVVGDDNHSNSNVASLSVTIAQAAPTYDTPSLKTGLTYMTNSNGSGQAQALVNTVTATNGTILYSTDDGAHWVNNPTGTNAGTYTVYYKVNGSNSNYSSVAKTSLGTVTIAKKNITSDDINLANETLTYTGSTLTRTVDNVAGLADSGNWSVTNNTATNASNSYSMTVSMLGTCQNYKGSATKTWSISPKSLSSTELYFANTGTITKNYIWEIGSVSNALTKPNGVSVTYSSNNTNVASVDSNTGALTPGSTADNTEATITATATGNYSGSTSYKIRAKSKVVEFTYKGYNESITLGAGRYQMECYGAQGSGVSGYSGHSTYTKSLVGGKGGYTVGTISFSSSKTLYIYVGGNTRIGSTNYSFNGGGYGTAFGTKCGGGATDIRVKDGNWDNFTSLKSRIMVAAGGGSAGDRGDGYGGGSGGYGGGLTGQRSPVDSRTRTNASWYQWFGPGGGQTGPDGAMTWQSINNQKPGWGSDVNVYLGKFGYAGLGQDGEGGGGWYGGAGGGHCGGAGGSSYISGHDGCRAIKQSATTAGSATYHESGSVATIDGVSYTFTSTSMTANARTGTGLARITWVGAY